jgi:hypothetical protein
MLPSEQIAEEWNKTRDDNEGREVAFAIVVLILDELYERIEKMENDKCGVGICKNHETYD